MRLAAAAYNFLVDFIHDLFMMRIINSTGERHDGL